MTAALGIGLGLLFALLFVAPLVVPLPPLRDVVPPEELAPEGGEFLPVGGVRVYLERKGSGDPAFVLLHGFGGSAFSWREVLPALGSWGTAAAFDRPGFGLTERPLRWEGPNPYGPEFQLSLTAGLMDRLGIGRAVLVGHSAGAGVALGVALAHPERVAALVLVAPAVGIGNPLPPWARALLATPQVRRLGPLFLRRVAGDLRAALRQAWHHPERVTPEVEEGYARPLRARGWDRGLWEVLLASRPLPLLERLPELRVPVLVVVGDDDRLVPPERGKELAARIPGAELAVLSACGHLPQEERPGEFLAALETFLLRHGLLREGRP